MHDVESILDMDALTQAEHIRNKQVTSAELVDAAIGRIERYNPKVNAVITPMFDSARAAAQGNIPAGPFAGVPFLVKDLALQVNGVRYTEGSAFLGEYKSTIDSELALRYKRAGLIILGKTNTPELGLLPTAEPKRFGPTRNPWDLTRSSGGSSGGTAAAVACRMVPFAHGNDGGGSIRIPASCCGLFGLKPTRGRVTCAPLAGDIAGGLTADHALTRTVRDSAALLDATCAPAPGDPYIAPRPSRPYLAEVAASPGRLRIGFVTSAGEGRELHEDCRSAVVDAAALCKELGHRMEEVAFPFAAPEIVGVFMSVWASLCAWQINFGERVLGRKAKEDDLEPLTWALCQMGRQVTAVDYMNAINAMQAYSRQVAAIFETYDVFLTPTLALPPPPLGSFKSTPENPLEGFAFCSDYMPFTPICNTTGQPAMSVPLFWSKQGLPIGSHFIGRYGDEATLFRLAGQLEQARPWIHRKPLLITQA